MKINEWSQSALHSQIIHWIRRRSPLKIIYHSLLFQQFRIEGESRLLLSAFLFFYSFKLKQTMQEFVNKKIWHAWSCLNLNLLLKFKPSAKLERITREFSTVFGTAAELGLEKSVVATSTNEFDMTALDIWRITPGVCRTKSFSPDSVSVQDSRRFEVMFRNLTTRAEFGKWTLGREPQWHLTGILFLFVRGVAPSQPFPSARANWKSLNHPEVWMELE